MINRIYVSSPSIGLQRKLHWEGKDWNMAREVLHDAKKKYEYAHMLMESEDET